MYNQHLIPLADTLNAARIDANRHVETESQVGIYGKISYALNDVLLLIVGDRQGASWAYGHLLDGEFTVTQAVEQVEKERTYLYSGE